MDDPDGTTLIPVYDDGTLRITSTVHPPGIRLEGELDRSGVPGLMTTLAGAAHMAAHGDGPFYADLSGLDFIDVNGLRVLVTAGLGTGGGSAGVIRVAAAPAVVLRLLRLTGWEGSPGWGEAPEWDQVPAVCLDEAQPDADGRGLIPAATNARAVDGGG